MRRSNTVYLLALSAILIAVMFIFGFTPLGTITTGALTITLMGIPVCIIASVFGPIMGAFAGLVWGSISMIQAFIGMDATGTMLLNAPDISWGTKITGLIFMCLVARILTGFLSGLFFDLVKRFDKRGYFASLAAACSTSLFNTFFFMTFFCLFFFNTGTVQDGIVKPMLDKWPGATNPFIFVIAIIGVNFIVEFVVNAVVGSLASFGIDKAATRVGVFNPLPRLFVKKEVEAKAENI